MRKLLVRLSFFLVVLSHAVPKAFGIVSISNSISHNQVLLSSLVSFDFDDSSMLKDSLKQEKRDSIKADTVYTHSYKKAMLWSAFIPGAGQIYNEFGYRKIPQKKNRAWWKVPIIYGLLGTGGYFFYDNLITAKYLKEEWLYRDNNAGAHFNIEYDMWDNDELLNGIITQKIDKNGNLLYTAKGEPIYTELPGFDKAAKRRDMLAFGLAAIWGLNVVEAIVDAHFVTFDVSSDLSLSWSPTMLNFSTPGLALRLNFN